MLPLPSSLHPWVKQIAVQEERGPRKNKNKSSKEAAGVGVGVNPSDKRSDGNPSSASFLATRATNKPSIISSLGEKGLLSPFSGIAVEPRAIPPLLSPSMILPEHLSSLLLSSASPVDAAFPSARNNNSKDFDHVRFPSPSFLPYSAFMPFRKSFPLRPSSSVPTSLASTGMAIPITHPAQSSLLPSSRAMTPNDSPFALTRGNVECGLTGNFLIGNGNNNINTSHILSNSNPSGSYPSWLKGLRLMPPATNPTTPTTTSLTSNSNTSWADLWSNKYFSPRSLFTGGILLSHLRSLSSDS